MAPISDAAFAALQTERSVRVQRVADARAALDLLERSGASDAATVPMKQSIETLVAESEPFELHYELEAAKRNLIAKQTDVATLRSGERPSWRYANQSEAAADVVTNPITPAEIKTAEEQVEIITAEIARLEGAIAAHPVAQRLHVAEPTSALISD